MESSMTTKGFTRVFGICAVLGLTACVETTQVGVPSDAKAKYSNVGLVTQISDNVVSTYWKAAFAEPQPYYSQLGWNAASVARGYVNEQLGPTGSVVASISSYTGPAAEQNDVVIVLQQTPLDILGQNYNPGRDFFALGGGLFALAAISGNRAESDQKYQSRFVLWVRNPEANKAIIGENACTVGLTASLVDPETGDQVVEGKQVTGRSVIPGALQARDWTNFSDDEKQLVISHCSLALRSAVSQALVGLGVFQ